MSATASRKYVNIFDQLGKVANPACGQLNRKNQYFSVPVRAWEFDFARRVRPARLHTRHAEPGAYLRGFLPCSAAASIYLFKPSYAIGPVPIYRITQLRTDGVHCRESTGTGPVSPKVVPNKSCLGRSP